MKSNYTEQEKKLAREIAEALDDWDSIDFHLQNARTYTEEYQRKILVQVMAVSQDRIKKSRAALYTYLINRDGRHGTAISAANWAALSVSFRG